MRIQCGRDKARLALRQPVFYAFDSSPRKMDIRLSRPLRVAALSTSFSINKTGVHVDELTDDFFARRQYHATHNIEDDADCAYTFSEKSAEHMRNSFKITNTFN